MLHWKKPIRVRFYPKEKNRDTGSKKFLKKGWIWYSKSTILKSNYTRQTKKKEKLRHK